MSDEPCSILVAVDIGNARIKLGDFFGISRPIPPSVMPELNRPLVLDGRHPEFDRLNEWTANMPGGVSWWIGSVNRPASTQLVAWLRETRPADELVLLAADDLPLEVRLERPDMVGIDRLLDAVAANHLRNQQRPAVVVDVGTAITVDLLASDGAFLGGAILPGIQMSARAMHEFTDLLPLIGMDELHLPPPALGTQTTEAMRSGLFWGAVGAVRELIGRLAEHAGGEPQVFLSGGAGPAVADLLGEDTQHVAHLTLGGIALTCRNTR